MNKSSQGKEDYPISPNSNNDLSSSFNLFKMPSYHLPIMYIGIISSNNHLQSSFITFFNETNSCRRKCIIIGFNDYNSLSLLLKRTPMQSLDLLIETEEDTEGVLSFKIKSKKTRFLIYESVYDSINLFKINPSDSSDDNNDMTYWISIQQILINFILKYNQQTYPREVVINQKPLYTKEIVNWLTNDNLLSIVPSILCMTFAAYVFFFIEWIISEKESKQSHLLFRQGISIKDYYLSWLITYILLTLLPILLLSIFLYKYFFVNISFLLIFISQFEFNLTVFAIIILFQSFVDNANSGQTLLQLFYFGLSFMSVIISQPQINVMIKMVFSLFPNFIHIINFEVLIMLDNYTEGIDWRLMNTEYNGLTLVNILMSYIIDFSLYISISFFIMRYKTMNGNTSVRKGKQENYINSPRKRFDYNHEDITDQEVLENKRNKQLLSIQHISKSYSENIDIKAVNSFTCDMYPNQIFCLLGHNGAGKTTLIKLLSGIETPDQDCLGDILLNGSSLINNRSYLYKNIGVCGQEDNLFEYLTVTEHLELICQLRGDKANTSEIMSLLEKIDLKDKQNAQCSTLSLGQKRKMSIALALVGNSRLVLLDEPTSGMDVIARRFLWDFLKDYKTDKIIILTTHSLEEAEYLGHRIGIMSEGNFICSGSSLYLKNKYSCGYNINFIGDSSKFNKDNKMLFANELYRIENTATIKVISKDLLIMNFIEMNSNTIAKIFQFVDKYKNTYGVINYTFSTTSLEDVFLRLNNSNFNKEMFNDNQTQLNKDHNDYDNDSIEVLDINPSHSIKLTSITRSCPQRLKADYIRNMISFWRNKRNFILELLIAVLSIFCNLFGFNSIMKSRNTEYQNINSVLSSNVIYYKDYTSSLSHDSISTFNIEVLKDMTTLYSIPITFQELPYNITQNSINDINELSSELYFNSIYKNEKAVIIFNKAKDNDIQINILYQLSGKNYFLALINMITSALLYQNSQIKTHLITSYAVLPDPDSDSQIQNISMIGISIIILWFGFINLSGFILETPLKERMNNIKHLLYLSGANMFEYWLSLFIIDFSKYIIFILIVFPILIWTNTLYVYILCISLFFLCAIIVMLYCLSFAFNKAEQGKEMYILFVFVVSFTFPAIYFIKVGLANIVKAITEINLSICDLFPTSTFLVSLLRIAFMSFQDYSIDKILIVTRNTCLIFLLQFLVYTMLLFLCEKRIIEIILHKTIMTILTIYEKLFSKRHNYTLLNQSDSNNDIESCKSIIESNSKQIKYTTSINQLSKAFYSCCGKKVNAVNNLTIRLEANEKFGLLGFNGSGKTTTFKSITNELLFDKGTIELFGYNLNKGFNTIRKSIGYCPQESALFDYLTVKETFDYFSKLKGLAIVNGIEYLCKQFSLDKYINTYNKNLSGGNKRKLSFAISIMNHPKLLLLDEPSTGVDPESRRVMWKNITELSSNHSLDYNMILSTHSMEEAEILCDTVGWLKQGQFLCVGNPEMLKLELSKEQYHLQIRFNMPSSYYNDEELDIDAEYLKINLKYNGKELERIDEQLKTYLIRLRLFIEKVLIDYCEEIELKEINHNKSFELVIKIQEQMKGVLFQRLLIYSMNDNEREITEMNIKLESLEKILTTVNDKEKNI